MINDYHQQCAAMIIVREEMVGLKYVKMTIGDANDQNDNIKEENKFTCFLRHLRANAVLGRLRHCNEIFLSN